MAFLKFEQVTADNTVKDIDDLSPPGTCTRVMLQADTQAIRYTADGSTSPTQSSGMILNTGEVPTELLNEDLRNIKFTRGAGSDAKLNIHYYGINSDS